MTDPYKVLEVDYKADEKQLKDAYKKMVKKYHPDRFQDPDAIAKANEKMTEINAAYDQIMEDRRLGVSPMKYVHNVGGYTSQRKQKTSGSKFRRYTEADYEQYRSSESRKTDPGIDLSDVREAVESGDLTRADEILGNVSETMRSAQWHYLKGMVYEKRGWLNEAYHSVRTATQMDPGNLEYAETFQQMNRSRSGYMTGGSSGGRSGGFCPGL